MGNGDGTWNFGDVEGLCNIVLLCNVHHGEGYMYLDVAIIVCLSRPANVHFRSFQYWLESNESWKCYGKSQMSKRESVAYSTQ